MVDLPHNPTGGLGASFGSLPFDAYNSRQAAVDGPIVMAAWTQPHWYTLLHGVAAEVAFWSCVVLAVGRALWFVVDLVARLRAGRSPKT